MRRRVTTGLLVLTAFGLTVMTACGSATLSTPIIGASVMVNHDKVLPSHQLDVPTLFAERNDPNLVYLSGVELRTGTCKFYKSTDHGYTWTDGSAPSLAPYTDCGPGSGQPLNFRTTMAEGSDGTLFLAYAAENPQANGPRNVLLARSTDRANNWTVTAIDTPPQPAAGSSPEQDFEPHVAVDPSNPKHVVVVWRHSIEGSGTRPYMATSTDGGSTFSAPAMMFDHPMGFDPPYPVIVNGTLAVSWHEPSSLPSSSQFSSSDKMMFSTSTDGGKTWTDTQVATGIDADTPLLKYDTTRNQYDMYWNYNGSPDPNASVADLDIFFSWSSNGKNWSTPVRVNDDPRNTGRDQWFPELSITSSGRTDMVWYDERNDPFPLPGAGNVGNRQDVYFSSSSDGGRTWSANVRLNDVTINRSIGTWTNQYYIVVPPAFVAQDGGDIAVWSDTRNGDDVTNTQDLYAAPVAYDVSTIPAGLKGASTGAYSSGDLALVGVVLGVTGILVGAGIAFLLTALRRRRAAESAPTIPAAR